MWNLRVRGPAAKTIVLKSCDANTLFTEFQNEALNALNLNDGAADYTFLSGYPPKKLDLSPSTCISTQIVNNDTIVVSQSSSYLPKIKASCTGKRPANKNIASSVHTLSNKKGRKRKSKLPISGGKRLGDGGEEQEDCTTRRRQIKVVALNSKDDVQEKLVNAISDSSKQDTASKFLRSATRNAVDNQYVITRANSRLKAALSQQFTVEEVEDDKISIRYKVSPRKFESEEVQKYTRQQLRIAVQIVLLNDTGKEMLKPFNMAQVSPRVFWNVARVFEGDIETGLKALVPEFDWSYLSERTRTLSAKALEAKVSSQKMLEQQREDMNDFETSWKEEEGGIASIICDACGRVRVVNVATDKVNINSATWTCRELKAVGRSGECNAEADDEVVEVTGSREIARELEDAWNIKGRTALADTAVEDLSLTFAKVGRRSSTKIESITQLEGFVKAAQEREFQVFLIKIINCVAADVFDLVVERLRNARFDSLRDIEITPSDLILQDVVVGNTPPLLESEIDQWKDKIKRFGLQHPWLYEWQI